MLSLNTKISMNFTRKQKLELVFLAKSRLSENSNAVFLKILFEIFQITIENKEASRFLFFICFILDRLLNQCLTIAFIHKQTEKFSVS